MSYILDFRNILLTFVGKYAKHGNMSATKKEIV